MPAAKYTQHEPSMKMGYDYHYGHICKKSHQKKVNPINIAGNAEEEEGVLFVRVKPSLCGIL